MHRVSGLSRERTWNKQGTIFLCPNDPIPATFAGSMPEADFKDVIEQVRLASDIVDVIGSYVPLKRAGTKFKALSPFQQEKTPSFYVDPMKQMFKCFSSGHGGSVFDFVMRYENLDFMGALRRLAERAKIEVPERGGFGVSKEQRSLREQLFTLHDAVATWWGDLLHRDAQAEKARAYLAGRDFSLALAKEFGFGFAPESWDATLLWAKKKGFAPGLLESAGLVKTREDGGFYDFFRGRLMIPIRNEIGKVVAFSGRLLDAEVKTAKYVNSPETPIFSKSRILFGLDKTKKGILDAGCAVLCEGQIDLIRCYEHGIRHVVAPQGTALTEHHAQLLKRFTNEVVVCFDADRAGRNAAVRSVEILLQAGLEIRIAAMPAGEDPDSLLRKKGGAVLTEILQSAPPYTRYLLNLVCREHDVTAPKGRTLAAQRMAEMVQKIPSPVQRQVVGLEIASRLQIPHALFQQEIHKLKAKPSERRTSAEASEDEEEMPFMTLPIVAHLLSLLLQHPEIAPHVQQNLDVQWLAQMEGGHLLAEMLNLHSHDAWEDAAHFSNGLPAAERNFVAGLIMNPVPLPDESSLEDFARQRVAMLCQIWNRQRMGLLEQEIKSNLLTPEQLLAKSKELLDLRRAGT